MDWDKLLPATAIVAIILFLAREGTDYLKKKAADARKLKAVKAFIAREIEFNRAGLNSIRQTLDVVDVHQASGDPQELNAIRLPDGSVKFYLGELDRPHASWPIRELRAEAMSKYMLDIATLNASLFARVEIAYDAILEAQHVRQSLLNYLFVSDASIQHTFEGFPQYALNRIGDAEEAIGKLYLECTQKPLTTQRLR